MKKIFSLILAITVIFSGVLCFAQDVTVMIDGAPLSCDVPPQIMNGRTMVPLRAIFEALGATVDWNDAERKVTATKEGVEISLTIDSNTAFVNGAEKTLDQAAVIVDSRTLVPLRFVGEGFGLSVSWNGETRLVTISSEKNSEYNITEVTAIGHDGNVPKNTIDNDYNTRWSCEGTEQWIMFELEENVPVGYIGVAYYSGDQRLQDFSIEFSENGVDFKEVWKGQSINGLEMHPYPALGNAKYVRFICNGNTSNLWNSITEVNIYPPTDNGEMPTEPFGGLSSVDSSKVSPEILEALVEVEDKMDKDAVLNFLSSLYDSETGGFYYAPSGRDMEGFLPDVESTAQVLSFIPKDKMPEELKTKIGTWVQGLQDEDDGYFYHPQWGKEINQERRGRDNTWSLGLLSSFNMTPLYKTVADRLKENLDKSSTSSSGGTSSLPEYLTSDAAFDKWISSLPWDSHPWGAGNSVNAVRNEIVAAGYYERAIDFIYSKQNPETGLWGTNMTPGIDEISGVMKISSFLLRGYPYVDKAIESILHVLENYEEIRGKDATILDMYNTWVSIAAIVQRCDDPKKLEVFFEKMPELLRISCENTMKFKKADGGFSYMRDKSIATSMGANVSMGLAEGDIGATTIAFHYIDQAYAAIGMPKPARFTEEQLLSFWEKLENAEPIEKREAPNGFEQTYSEGELSDFVLPKLSGSSSVEITKDPYSRRNRVLYFQTHAAGQNGFSINTRTDATDKRLVFETDIMFDENCFDQHWGLIRVGDKGYELRFQLANGYVHFLDKQHWSDAYPMTYIAKNAMKTDDWYTLKIEIEPNKEEPNKTKIRFYVDDTLLSECNRYYHNGYPGTEPTTVFTKVVFESFNSTDGGVYLDNVKMYVEEK